MKNRHKHLTTVTILRMDGTPWVIEHVKHAIFKKADYAFYVGEHGKDREAIIVPRARVDHLRIQDEIDDQI